MTRQLVLRDKDLDERELAFVNAVLRGSSIGDAAEVAGYPHRSAGYHVMRRSRVQAALHEFRLRVIQTEGATLALRTLIELMDKKAPAGVRFNAAKTVLAMAGHRVEGDPAGRGDKPLHEMGEDELRKVIAEAERKLAGEGESDGSAQPGRIEASQAQPEPA